MRCPNCGKPMKRQRSVFKPFYHWEDERVYYELENVAKCDKCDIVNSEGHWIIPDNLQPTEKQERTVAFIEHRLNVFYDPEVKLRRNCSDFIAKYFEQAKKEEVPSSFTEEDCDCLGLDASMFY